MSPPKAGVWVIAAGILLSMSAFPDPVHGWAQVEGHIDALTIEARDAPIAEVLTALGMTLGLRIRATTTLDKVISGTYRGTLQRVIGRILVDRDYVAKYAEDAVDILVLGPGNAAAFTSAVVPIAPPISAMPGIPRPQTAPSPRRRGPPHANATKTQMSR
jgi:hypothetical protein